MVEILDSPKEFILSHDLLASQRDRGDSASANIPNFKQDYLKGRLRNYNNTFVAYHKGVLCGQSKYKQELFDKATNYYGFTNLAVFRVPVFFNNLEDSVKHAIGDF